MILYKIIDSKIDRFNLYKRNNFKYLLNYGSEYCRWEELRKICAYLFAEINSLFLHRVYLNYVEIPITTQCTLKCKECTNLIQYYEKPYQINYKDIVKDISKLCEVTYGIGMLRILGGEPFLHKDLDKIINYISMEPKIKNIQIVTNGTIIPADKVLKAMRNKKVSVDISNYGDNSYKITELIQSLKKNRIKYFVSKNLYWTCSSDFSYKRRNKKQLEDVMRRCHLDCINILNGKLHLCPRSSHGNDLKIFNAKERDFYNIREKVGLNERKKNLRNVLNRKYITACNYCDVFMWQDLPECVPGEQITKKEALQIFNYRIKNKGQGR